MVRRISLCCLLLTAVVSAEPVSPEALVRNLEKEMAAMPGEAFALARQGADQLKSQPKLVRRLFRTAAGLQQKRLALLSKDQVVELADVYAKTLDEPATAEDIRRQWLRLRENALVAGDARSRVELGRLALDWLGDRDWAFRLGRDAYQLDPDLAAARELLHDRLGYDLTEEGWVLRPAAGRDWKEAVQGVHRGMTPTQVRSLLGPPRRVARQILYKRYLEQWQYDTPLSVVVEFDCVKGRDPHVLNVHQAAGARP
jgi:hypothetical protein